MRDENGLGCSYAVAEKAGVRVVIILRDAECAVFGWDDMLGGNADFHYLLLKHYADEVGAYRDFLKLIGKMCKKAPDSKYFLGRRDEDNRMVCGEGGEHMITPEERNDYATRYAAFMDFVRNTAGALAGCLRPGP